jgi:hypothetical protein
MPRPRQSNLAGAALGAVVGAALAGWPGAAIGGALGAQESPLSLEEALAKLCRERGLDLVSVSRVTKTAIALLFRRAGRSYWSLDVEAGPHPDMSPDAIDDRLYDRSVAALDAWKVARGA